MACTGKSTKL